MFLFFFKCYVYHRDLPVLPHSSPTRRSSDRPVVAQQAVSLSAVHRESDEASARHPRPLVMQAGIGHRASWRRGLIPFSFQLSAGSISRNSSESAKYGVTRKSVV